MDNLKWDNAAHEDDPFDHFGRRSIQRGVSLFDKEHPADAALQAAYQKQISMNIPPGNPTETEIDKLNAELGEYDEAIKKQKHIRWLAGVEITRIEKSRTATLKAIETITKGPES